MGDEELSQDSQDRVEPNSQESQEDQIQMDGQVDPQEQKASAVDDDFEETNDYLGPIGEAKMFATEKGHKTFREVRLIS